MFTEGTLPGLTRVVTGLRVDKPDQRRQVINTVNDYLTRRMTEGDVGVMERFYGRGQVDPELKDLLSAVAALERQGSSR